jgi:hypothetical protein
MGAAPGRGDQTLLFVVEAQGRVLETLSVEGRQLYDLRGQIGSVGITLKSERRSGLK